MAQIIEFPVRRDPLPPPASLELKMCCARCGAEAWTIFQGGQVCCSDCEETCPYRINFNCEALQ